MDHTNQLISELENILSISKDAETGQRGYLLTGRDEFLEPYTGAYGKTSAMLGNIRNLVDKDNIEQQQAVNELDRLIARRFAALDNLITVKRNGGAVTTPALLDGKASMDQLRDIIAIMEQRERKILNERVDKLNKFSASTPIFILLAAVLSLIVTIVAFSRIRIDYVKRLELQNELERKDRETTKRITIIEGIADKVAAGNYTIRVQDDQKDGLGSLSGSLNKMAESLDLSFKQLSDKQWLQTGMANLNGLIAGEQDMNLLTGKIIDFIVDYTHSSLGAFFLVENQDQLKLSGSYALDPDSVEKIFKKGEGIVGQVAAQGSMITIDNLDKEPLFITFASGKLKPHALVVFPVLYEGTVMGVIELGTTSAYTGNELLFLKNSAETIGVAINSAIYRRRLQELLEETQAQAEELLAQQSELENLNSELESQAQKLQASEEELRVQQEELIQSNQELAERSNLLQEKNKMISERTVEVQEKAEQLIQSNKYKSEFLANMSHELRTPLNSILLLSRLMAENKNKKLDSEQVSYASVIRSSGEGLLRLIDEILDLSKIESGKMTLEYADTTVKEIVSDLEHLFAPVAREKNLSFKISVDPIVPVYINTDKTHLEQILKNLLSNALKFTSTGSVTLDITTHQKDTRFLDFTVTDTGIGIAASKQQLVFEAFQQADGSTRRKYGGTGLGLSISRELTKLLAGEISLTSEEEKGSQFIVTIPIQKPEPQYEPQPGFISEGIFPATAEESSSRDSAETIADQYTLKDIPASIDDDRATTIAGYKSVLIVEDDREFATVLINFARDKGYKVLAAVSGDEGIELARKHQPFAILLDIVLPVKSGWEVMEEIKSDPKTRHIPVHIMSSLQARREGLQKGAVDFINKPVALEQLQEIFGKLENVLQRKSKKVLIVEENSHHAKALAFFLDSFNVKSEIQNDVDASILSLHKKGINCVILDMGIPGEKAYETLEAVRKNPGLEDTPIIIFTGQNLSRTEEGRIRKYADSIVVKTAHSYQRILDEVTLFLHLVTENQSSNKKSTPGDKNWKLKEMLAGKTILLADDDVRNVFSMTKLLEQYQLNVISATDGKEAFRLLQEHPETDLVLMDIMMPEMDGFETIRSIRKKSNYKNLPILAVTAKAMPGDREKCIQAGASDYISKPIDIDQLISLLRVWLYDREA